MLNVETSPIGRGDLGLEARLSDSVGFSDALQQMQIDVWRLEQCVVQTLDKFAAAGGAVAELDHRECMCYCAQAMFAAVALSMGDWEAIVVNSSEAPISPAAAEALDRLVESELFRIGVFNPIDSAVVRQYKHMVFHDAWRLAMENDLLRCGQHLQGSIARVVGDTLWVQNGFVSAGELDESDS